MPEYNGLLLPSEPAYERKPAGVIIVDGQDIASTVQCCHCNCHFISVKGSGQTRGFCTLCMARTCGKPECDVCTPFEKKIADYERGKRVGL